MGNNTRGEFHNFMVWRTYHDLKDALGRIPYANEIADDLDITHSQVCNIIKGLKSCETSINYGMDKVECFEILITTEKEVDKFFEDNGIR